MSLTYGYRRALLAPGLTVPQRILGASLLGYWDAELINNITLSGSQVITWTDIVAGYAVTQAVSGLRPVYSSTGFNSRPVITFDGSDDQLTLASVPFPTGASASEVWVLVDQTALPADTTGRRAFSYGDANATSRQVFRSVLTGVNRAQGLVGDGAVGQTSADGVVDLSGRHVIRMAVGATSTNLYVDGGSATNFSSVPATSTARTRIGSASAAGASNYWQGGIAAVLVTSTLSVSQATQLTAYLKIRGGIA